MKKITAITAILLLLSQSFLPVSASSFKDVRQEIKENDERVEEMEEKREEINLSIAGLNKEMEQLVLEMNRLSRDIGSKELDITEINGEIGAKEQELLLMESDVETIEKNIEEMVEGISEKEIELKNTQSLLGERVRSAYINNVNQNIIYVIFESEGLLDLFERLKFVETIVKMDNLLLEQLKEKKEELEKDRGELEDTKREHLIELSFVKNHKARLQDDRYKLQKVELDLRDQHLRAEELEKAKILLISSMTEKEMLLAQEIGDILIQNESLERELQAMYEKQLQGQNFIPSEQGFLRPTAGRLTSPFGNRLHPIWKDTRFHNGIDLAAPTGTPIHATKDGEVINSSYKPSYGNLVIVNHGGGFTSYYAHLDRFDVKVGDVVKQGQKIGEMGSTGDSTGPHLHFEIRKENKPENPLKYIK